MKTVSQHIEQIKSRPHHVRKRVAFGTAAVITAVIALAWLVGSVSTGVFALKPTSFADSAGQESVVVVGNENGSTNLAGVAATLSSPDAPAHIEIVDTTPPKAQTKKAEPTTIPF